MEHIQQAGGIVVNLRDQILVIKNRNGSYTFPKGAIEANEDPLQAARREILEEAGIDKLTMIKELGVIERPGFVADNYNTPSVIKHIRVYLFTTTQTDLQPQLHDGSEPMWVEMDQVASRLSYKAEQDFFEQHRKDLNR